jgi:hypothetical protein
MFFGTTLFCLDQGAASALCALRKQYIRNVTLVDMMLYDLLYKNDII